MLNIAEKKKRPRETVVKWIIYFAAFLMVTILAVIIGYTLYRGLTNVNWSFLTSSSSVLAKTVGILPNIINTLYIVAMTLAIVTPIGVGAAIYLTEYVDTSKFVKAVEFATEILSGIPSIIYGLFGSIFFGVFLGFGYSILAGSITMSIMTLPIIMRTTQDALRAVPDSYREGAMGIGATKWYMIKTIVLPSALPGIITAIILVIGRVVAESAALIFTAGIGTNMPKGLFGHSLSSGATLTVELYQYASNRGDNATAFAIASVLIILVVFINLATKLISKRGKKI